MGKLLLSILLLFCSLVLDANKFIIGKYSMRYGMERDDLTLYRNHRFRIYSANFEGEHPSISKGKWTQSKDTIILFYQSVKTAFKQASVKSNNQKRFYYFGY